ncbi:hypothetical protein A3F03_04060 [Candidatus Roizmanbacteria bacterium RIFCSPHIGHO2_12_FULL_41_11]|uniref:PIN domain-containing protein n=3 Tax=Candidatus Roizmaniibacteriota TaxID=1752723 RepID=A0A1F7JQZ5_9BACT|nr:MAG: hypothetical protein A3F03_04060 [Candidatus Roizmanbacteria bacterium RIFCSPHIGHO2_12_FULL_41_11]OGK51978.1 MAG: hypothetical protein A2966_04195 [Candidatus Roizmanbacteria bacterium RIFCSPLOWO2_01_FULL_41_22]OGK58022.1 MAG: hypothetical protein A3H86_01000 [Candidatus Roizmanbacteria bacterium RIFCSPLOWO2_02_FULL_41_9]
MRKKSLLDANTIVRFFTGNPLEQAKKVRHLFTSSPPESLFIADTVILEVIYVLSSFYRFQKTDIIQKFSELLEDEVFVYNKKLIKSTWEFFKNNSISFVDAYLCALTETEEPTTLYSFDKRLQKILPQKVKEP